MPRDRTDPNAEIAGRLPANPEAERELLGMLILNGELLDSIADSLGERLRTEDFSSRRHQLIYDAILARAQVGGSYDTAFLQDFLQRHGDLERAGGAAYLMDLTQITAAYEAAGEYAGIIKDAAKRRGLILLLQEISHLAYEPGDLSTAQVLDRASERVLSFADSNSAQSDDGPRDALTITSEVIDRISEDIRNHVLMRGIATGFTELDSVLSGLRGESLYILAARPGVGKTTLAMNIVENVATNELIRKPALVFSMEMPATQLIERMLSTFGRVTTTDLTTPNKMTTEQWQDIMRQVYLLAYKDDNGELHNKLYIDDTGSLTPGELCARARRLYQKEGLSLIMVDYLQLMHGDRRSENRAVEVGEISRALKVLAKELNVPVLALCQLRREVEGRQDKRPMNSDLRESGALEQDADVIMLIHRPKPRYVPDPEDNAENAGHSDDGMAILMVSKNRHGATADIKLNFQGEYTAFYDYVDSRQQINEAPVNDFGNAPYAYQP